jgi:hypothetical protein
MIRRLIPILALVSLAACQTPPQQTPLAAVPLAPPAPLSPLDRLTRLSLPPEADTVAKAARYILEPTGYQLLDACLTCPPEAADIDAKPVSPLALHAETTNIRRALILIGGSKTRIIVDEHNRTIAYAYIGAEK